MVPLLLQTIVCSSWW